MHHLLFVFVFLFSFNLMADNETSKGKEFISQQTLDLTTHNNEFAFNLYKELADVKSNIFFSPYSISSAFAMVYNGAREETQKEMGEVLKFNNSADNLNESFSLLNRYFLKTSSDVTSDFHLYIANSLWLQNGTQILPQFLDQMAKYYKVAIHRVDFLRQKETARREINQFVKEKTMGKIVDLLSPKDIDESTKMVLVSSIYMKAKWRNLFDSNLTKMMPFFVDSEKTITASLMNQTGFYPYFKSDNFAAVSLPYIHPNENLPDLSFLIILPKENFGLGEIQKKLDTEYLKNILSSFEDEEINIFLPKFTFTKSFSLKDVLIKMGMVTAFNSQANFEGINGQRDLQIGQVAHKAFISVNESGTESSAATSISINMKSMLQPKEPIIFRVDHPFLFIIYEKMTGSVLFCGHVVNPLE